MIKTGENYGATNVTVLGVADKPVQSYISEIAAKIKEKAVA
jgi:hypothetical protein